MLADGRLMNVLMLMVDDLRPVGRAFGDAEALMPNLDALASRATIFTNAYVQAPTCGASRSSLLTSRRPDTTQVLTNTACPFTNRPEHASWVSLPQYFKRSGYRSIGLGKVFHPNVCDGAAAGEQAAAWSEPYYHAPCIALGSIYNHTCYESYPGPLPEGPGGKVTSIFENATADSGDDMPDGMIAARAARTLHALGAAASNASTAKPFFMAVGFHKPHLPHIAPKEYFDLYPLERVSLPDEPSRSAPQGAPDGTWNQCGEFLSYKNNEATARARSFDQRTHLNDTETRVRRRAYYAAASFADEQMGRVLSALRESGLAESTVLTLFGDHGWHIGENNEWAKHTAMTWANRAPLLFAVPGGHGRVVANGFAEFVDIFPTLADLAGLPVPPRCADEGMSLRHPNCTEGASLATAVRSGGGQSTRRKRQGDGRGGEDEALAKTAAFGQWPMKVEGERRMGYNLYTRLPASLDARRPFVRYTEWALYNDSGPVHGPIWLRERINELYNRSADPNENFNLAGVASLRGVVDALSSQLRAGWRGGAELGGPR